MSEYTNIKSNIDKCTAREKYLIDIIEKQREIIKRDEKYMVHLSKECFENGCDCVLVELGEDRSKILKLTEEPKNETLRSELGTFGIDTTPDELQRLREEG